ncbi:hypothetical protein FKO01_21800 [Mesorhizobium sp. B2-3-3]|nr:hypothetical protein FKO01_21800 [Mesorhizobium sp. B2-3-3]
MAAATELSVWSVLLPVIVGGALTLLGVALGPAVTQWLETRSAMEQKRAQRFEELLALLQSQDEWLELKRLVYAFGETREIPSEPLAKALAISALYFPEFLSGLKQYDLESTRYSLWISGAARRRLEKSSEPINDGFDVAYETYRKNFLEVRERIIQHAVSRNGKV